MEVLDLSWNKLRRRGAVAVAKGVKVGHSVWIYFSVSLIYNVR